ncbi:MAG: S8 family serine peptidase [Thermoanaerobaculia bacterium]
MFAPGQGPNGITFRAEDPAGNTIYSSAGATSAAAALTSGTVAKFMAINYSQRQPTTVEEILKHKATASVVNPGGPSNLMIYTINRQRPAG